MDSLWKNNLEKREFAPLPGDRKINTVIIGGGMAGILIAYYLGQVGVPAIVLEADRVGSGQTGKTTAKITSQHNLIYDKLLRVFGKEKAIHYASASEKAIDAYEQLVEREKIDCDFERCSSFLFSRKREASLKAERKAAEQLGLPVRYKSRTELPFPVAGAVEFQNQAKFHPLHFLYHLAESLTIYEKTRVLKVEGNQVVTDRGTVEAEKIVFACHYPFVNIPGYYFARMYQERSYVLALKQAQKLKNMYLEVDGDQLSFRSQGNILLLGGGAHRTGKNNKGGRYELLREKAEKFWPECREVARWSAQDAMTLDGVPYIGKFSGKKEDWYVATGFGKWGMTASMVSARLITADIIGHPLVEGDIFSPQRKITGAAMKGLAGHSFEMMLGLGKRLVPAWERKSAGGKRVVPVCPHMGCRLIWNPEEKTYECPCHGSRFDEEGCLMDDPAQSDCCYKK